MAWQYQTLFSVCLFKILTGVGLYVRAAGGEDQLYCVVNWNCGLADARASQILGLVTIDGSDQKLLPIVQYKRLFFKDYFLLMLSRKEKAETTRSRKASSSAATIAAYRRGCTLHQRNKETCCPLFSDLSLAAQSHPRLVFFRGSGIAKGVGWGQLPWVPCAGGVPCNWVCPNSLPQLRMPT